MTTFLSLVTSIRDYTDILHRLVATDSAYQVTDYFEFGALFTYGIMALKAFFYDLVTFAWLKSIWDLPIIVPEINSAMISEVSVLDGYFHNAFNFLDRPVLYGEPNILTSSAEKFMIGFINSLFLFLPTSTTHLVTARRFIMEGISAGYLSAIASLSANLFWIGSILFGCRFIVIPWLSFDIFRYLLGFLLLIKFIWYCYQDKPTDIDQPREKQKIFIFNFILTLTEQASVLPFIRNLTVGPEASAIEGFPYSSYFEFIAIHSSYLLGLLAGSLILLHFTCWFWENPFYKFYLWLMSLRTTIEGKLDLEEQIRYSLKMGFTFLTSCCAMTSIPYYGTDYLIAGSLGYQENDIAFMGQGDFEPTLEMSVFATDPADYNTRVNKGRHGRTERWKKRVRLTRALDIAGYEDAEYTLFPLEDLNYGFDRFWARRTMRPLEPDYYVFPKQWMRAAKSEMLKPKRMDTNLERFDYFKMVLEQFYSPTFHESQFPLKSKAERSRGSKTSNAPEALLSRSDPAQVNDVSRREMGSSEATRPKKDFIPSELASEVVLNNDWITLLPKKNNVSEGSSKVEKSTLRKLTRKITQRLKNAEIRNNLKHSTRFKTLEESSQERLNQKRIYSKRWKKVFSDVAHGKHKSGRTKFFGRIKGVMRKMYYRTVNPPQTRVKDIYNRTFNQPQTPVKDIYNHDPLLMTSVKKEQSHMDLSKMDKQIFKYRDALFNTGPNKKPTFKNEFLRPLNYYLNKQDSFERKLRYYMPTLFRKHRVDGNAAYFGSMMQGHFYYYKPNHRYDRTLHALRNRALRRKRETPPRRRLNLGGPRNVSLASPSGSEPESTLDGTKDKGLSSVSENQLQPTNSVIIETPYTRTNKTPAEIEAEKWQQGRREQLSTRSYTIIGKRAARYRNRMFRDVLTYWYYSPFNRLLLRFDVDAFMNRQPKSHFLTKNEENLMHLRRFLLFEHYNTLRWYTYMQHYRSMKLKIGGTKSFASGAYNQQFAGTFKKVRHLFAITPSDTLSAVPNTLPSDRNVFMKEKPSLEEPLLVYPDETPSILKFDQPLYNEYPNTSNNSIPKNFIVHEELIPEFEAMKKNGIPTDLISQSTQVIRDYLKDSHNTKQSYIKFLIETRNYPRLITFINSGRKTRGLRAVLNETSLANQEQDALFTPAEKKEIQLLKTRRLHRSLRPFQKDLWVLFLTSYKKYVTPIDPLYHFTRRRMGSLRVTRRLYRSLLRTKLEYFAGQIGIDQMKSAGRYVNYLHKTGELESQNPAGYSALQRLTGPSLSFTEEQELLNNTVVPTAIDRTLVAGASTIRPREPNWLRMGNKSQENERFRNTFNWDKGRPKSGKTAVRRISQMNLTTKTIFVGDLNRASLGRKQKQMISSLNTLSSVLQKQKRKVRRRRKVKPQILRFREIPVDKLVKRMGRLLIQLKNNLKESLSHKSYLKRHRKPLVGHRERYKWRRKMRESMRGRVHKAGLRLDLEGMVPLGTPKKKGTPFHRDFDRWIKKSIKQEEEKKKSVEERLAAYRAKVDKGIFGEDYHPNRWPKFNPESPTQARKRRKKNDKDEMERRYRQRLKRWPGRLYIAIARRVKKLSRKSIRTGRIRRLGRRKPYRRGFTKKAQFMEIRKMLAASKDLMSDKPLTRAQRRQIPFDHYQELLGREPHQISRKNPFRRVPIRKSKMRLKKLRIRNRRLHIRPAYRKRLYKKMRRYPNPQLRFILKRLAKERFKARFKHLWWQKLLPDFRSDFITGIDAYGNKLIKQKYESLSEPEILNRNENRRNKMKNLNPALSALEIGDNDFKPLVMPRAIELRRKNIDSKLSKNKETKKAVFAQQANTTPVQADTTTTPVQANTTPVAEIPTEVSLPISRLGSSASVSEGSSATKLNKGSRGVSYANPTNVNKVSKGVISQVLETSFLNPNKTTPIGKKPSLVPTTSVPFYAGWDESLRKFVVTNRLLTLRDADSELRVRTDYDSRLPKQINMKQGPSKVTTIKFTTPLKGMGAGQTVYITVPFATFDPDQFYPIGFDSYAPVGWRRFAFRQTILRTWLHERAANKLGSVSSNQRKPKTKVVVRNKTNILNKTKPMRLNSKLNYKIDEKVNPLFVANQILVKAPDRSQVFRTRFRLKRIERVRRQANIAHSSPPPVGPRLVDVLPIHYAFLFYKNYRDVESLYIKRLPLETFEFNEQNQGGVNLIPGYTSKFSPPDFTLRRLVKPRRRYHIIRPQGHSFVNPYVIPRRVKFLRYPSDPIRWRPLGTQVLDASPERLFKELREQRYLNRYSAKPPAPPAKNKEEQAKYTLEARNVQQVIRHVPRPQAAEGGYTWEDDYLLLYNDIEIPEIVGEYASRDKATPMDHFQEVDRPVNRKVHNYKVLKKRLKNARRSNKLRERMNQLRDQI